MTQRKDVCVILNHRPPMAVTESRSRLRFPVARGWYATCLRPGPGDLTRMTDSFPIAVITAREPVRDNPWIAERWRVLGVVPGQPDGARQRAVIRTGPEGEQYLWGGLSLRLRPAVADAYYFNLVGQQPSLQVICHRGENGELRPVAVTADYIDAMAHGEAGADVHAVPIPAEIYVRLEQFVLDHYQPDEEKPRRKHDARSEAPA